MATCWTCGSPVNELTYACPTCQGLKELTELRAQVSSAGHGLDRLALVQQQGFLRLQATISRGLSQIASAVEWGFAEVAWQMLQQTEVLKGIDHTLRTPSETQANEYRLMADELQSRGVLDQAADFYRKAVDLNPLDYRTYVGSAQTLLRTNQFHEAHDVLEKSLPHAPQTAQGDIADWRSYSLRLMGHIDACQGDYQAAAKALREAVLLSPSYAEALFDHAQYAAQAGDAAGCLQSLERAIALRPIYWYLAQRQRAFAKVQEPVKALLVRLRADLADQVGRAVRSCSEELARATEQVQLARRMLDYLRTQRFGPLSLQPDDSQQAIETDLARFPRLLEPLDVATRAKDYQHLLSAVAEARSLHEELVGLNARALQAQASCQASMQIARQIRKALIIAVPTAVIVAAVVIWALVAS